MLASACKQVNGIGSWWLVPETCKLPLQEIHPRLASSQSDRQLVVLLREL